jgi:hypothetical protein
MRFLRLRVCSGTKLRYYRNEPSAPWSGAGFGPILHHDGVINVHYDVLRAAYEIPLCVSYLFLVVQSLRALLNDMREYYAQAQTR